jgi:uncharacterized protein YidB (DUF937 family)
MRKNTMPSLAALLGLLAIAGYQNREKLGELLKGAANSETADKVVKGASDMAASLGIPASVTDGIKGVVDSFRAAGHGEAADSWVGTGANQPVSPQQTETALGTDLIDMLVKQTGLSKDEILKRLAEVLPEAVDKATPEGRLPA